MVNQTTSTSGPSSSSNSSAAVQHLNGASGNPGANSGQVQSQIFTRSTGPQIHSPQATALALANWSVKFIRLQADLQGLPSDQQRHQMAIALDSMMKDPNLPREWQSSANAQLKHASEDTGYGARNFNEFTDLIRVRSLDIVGYSQDARLAVFQALYPTAPTPTIPVPPNVPQPANLNFGPAQQSAHVMPATHGGSGSRVSTQIAQNHTASAHDPSNARAQALALANWASTFERIFMGLRGPMDKEARNRIENVLLKMSDDPSVPEEFRQRAFDQFANFSSTHGVRNLGAFEQSVRSASLARAGHSRNQVQQLLDTATRSIHDDVRQQNLPPSMNGASAVSSGVFHLEAAQSDKLAMAQGPMGTTGTVPSAVPISSIHGLQSNQNIPGQPVHHMDPAFSLLPEERAPLNSNASGQGFELMHQMLRNPTSNMSDLAEERLRNGSNAGYGWTYRTLLRERLHLAFGASEATRALAEKQVRSSYDLDHPEIHRTTGQVLTKSNAKINPIISDILGNATQQYVQQGGQRASAKLEDLAPYVVGPEHQRIYEAFVNKPENYITLGPVSPGPISVEASRLAMAARSQPQPQPQLQPQLQQPTQPFANPLAQFQPAQGNPSAMAEAGTTSASDPNKRQRVSGQFNSKANIAPVAPTTIPLSRPLHKQGQQTQQPALAAMPFGQQGFLPGQTETGSVVGQPSQAIGFEGAMATPYIQPSQAPMFVNQAPMQTQPQSQLQPQPYAPQPQQMSSGEAMTQKVQSVQPAQPQPLLASQQQPQQLQTAQTSTQPQPFQASLQPLPTQPYQALPQQFQPMQQPELQTQPQPQQMHPLQAMTQPVQSQPQQPQVQTPQQSQQPQVQQPLR